MSQNTITKFLTWFLGIILFCGISSAFIPDVYSLEKPSHTHQSEIISELTKANIIYLGETHDSLPDHQAQLGIIQALYQHNPKIAIALEMFQRPYQSILDDYIAGKISESELIKQTEYNERWGFNWEYYAPILQFSQANNLTLLALNTPSEITLKVSRQGLESLSAEEQEYIPPLQEIRTDDQAYRQMIKEIYEQHLQGNQGNSNNFERFFTTQVLWDETMAEIIAKFYRENPNYQIVVLAGKGHIVYNYGIPNRVARRLQGLDFVQRSVLMGNYPDKITSPEKGQISDFFWQHDS